jgi:hypothetical protein
VLLATLIELHEVLAYCLPDLFEFLQPALGKRDVVDCRSSIVSSGSTNSKSPSSFIRPVLNHLPRQIQIENVIYDKASYYEASSFYFVDQNVESSRYCLHAEY